MFTKLINKIPKLVGSVTKYIKNKLESDINNNKNSIIKKLLLSIILIIEKQTILIINHYSIPIINNQKQNNINDFNLKINQSSLCLSSSSSTIKQEPINESYNTNNFGQSLLTPSPTLKSEETDIENHEEINFNINDDSNIKIDNDEQRLDKESPLQDSSDQKQIGLQQSKHQQELIQKEIIQEQVQIEKFTQQQISPHQFYHHHKQQQLIQLPEKNLNLLHIDQLFIKNQLIKNGQQCPQVSLSPSALPLYDFKYSIKFQSDFINVPKPLLLQQEKPEVQGSLQQLFQEEEQYQRNQQQLYQEQSYQHLQQHKRKKLLSKNLVVYKIDQDFIKIQTTNNHGQVSFAPSILASDKFEYSIKFQSDILLQAQQTNQFKFISQGELIDCDRHLGSGQFCHVFEAMYKCLPVAVKVPIGNGESFIQSVRSEIEIIKRLDDHPNVIKYYGFTNQGPVISIVLELMKKDLKKLVVGNSSPPSLGERIKYAIDICHGVKEIHRVGIIHRDLKLDNIMVDANGTAKITDFGLSDLYNGYKIQDGNNGAKGTPIFMAPEVLINQPFDTKIDIFSIGIIFFELFTCEDAYNGYNGCYEEFRNSVVYNGLRPTFPRYFPFSLKSLITKCWNADPEKRPSINQIINILNTFSIDC